MLGCIGRLIKRGFGYQSVRRAYAPILAQTEMLLVTMESLFFSGSVVDLIYWSPVLVEILNLHDLPLALIQILYVCIHNIHGFTSNELGSKWIKLVKIHRTIFLTGRVRDIICLQYLHGQNHYEITSPTI